MKNQLITAALVSFIFSFQAYASKQEVKEAAKITGESISAGRELPGGFKFEELSKRPILKKPMLNYLAELEEQAEADFIEFVDSNPEEFGRSAARAKKDPKKYLQTKFLIELETSYKIFKNGRLIGYAFQCQDHVDAAKIQDGSWMIIYVDENMDVVTVEKFQS